MFELDLHGLTTEEAIRVFVDAYNRHQRSGSREPLCVIHGYGSSGEGGAIRKKIRGFLDNVPDSLTWKPGEDAENNPGITLVYPRKALPSVVDQLGADIVAFCATPRTESKIAGAFLKRTPREIKQAIRTLVRQGSLKEIVKSGHATYVAQDRDRE